MACSCRHVISGLMNAIASMVDVGAAQPAVANQAAQDVVQPLAAVAHALVEIEAAALGEADAVGHQDAEQLLFARLDEAVEGGAGQPQQQGAAVGDRAVGERRQPLDS